MSNRQIAEALTEQQKNGAYADETVSAAIDALKSHVPQGVVDQIRWERDMALTQLAEIGKGLGSKMDDIVVLIKPQKQKDCEKSAEEGQKKVEPMLGSLYDGRCCEDICKHYPPGKKWPCEDCDIRIHDRAEL